MVKTVTENSGETSTTSSDPNNRRRHGVARPSSDRNSGGESCKYKGVRKRKWGKWVSEIRLPNSRERIWLGSYDSAEKAARAFDAANFCLRGSAAKFNFPNNPPEIPGGRSLTPSQIQAAAAQFANSEFRVGSDQSATSSSGSDELQQADSPSPSVSDGPTHLNGDMGHQIAFDNSFLDQFATMGPTQNSVPDFGIFPGFDDFSNEYFMAPPFSGADDYVDEEASSEYTSQGSFLWNF